eukprot:Skav211858  [mRNA]  locus=scaffold1431:1867:6364:+ [translate_table: standard]
MRANHFSAWTMPPPWSWQIIASKASASGLTPKRTAEDRTSSAACASPWRRAAFTKTVKQFASGIKPRLRP